MSTSSLAHALTPARRDESHSAPLNIPFDQVQGNSYSSTNSLPGLSHQTSAFSPTSILPADYSIAPGVCDTGHVNYFPNYQGHGTVCPPAGFIPARENAEPSMNYANFQAPCYSLYNIPDGTATDATALMLSECTGDQEQTSLSTFQYGFPTHPQAVLAQQQVGLKYEPQYAKEDLAVKEPQWEPAQVQSENGQTQASHPTLVEPENTKVHSCGNNPRNWCSGNGVICLDSLRAFISEYPLAFSQEKLLELVIKAISPEFFQYAAGQRSQIDINDTDQLQSQNGPIWRTEPSGLSATVSASTPATSESYLSPPDNIVVTPPAMYPVRSVTRKRKRPVKYSEDPKNRGQSMNTQDGPKDDGAPHANITVDDRKKGKKKRKCTDGDLICFICEILGNDYQPLSRRNALKRHYSTFHGMFQMLLNDEYSHHRILQSRNFNQLEDIRSLILFCVNVQAEARARGVEVEEEDDIALSQHPDVRSALYRSS
ncbi:hypothetical protein L210DRAFT_3651381 [Boletus edulis BED1]|uniref:Uncharacterized protein n=1 Tax=Boletus edulis BED1 TaxID=1328754 RepID=A0AAD4BHV0_BOLED|nr:hypothetical protein L210DRAFT_3651381 [Boletus edulis BED1]